MTGTREDRPEFQRLMSDCRGGKIDIILTKSISRFARNTVTLLEAVRELKELNVDVQFEKENIHSLSGDGELMLTILASFAQEESLSTSENIKWRFRKRFEAGKPSMTAMLGYKLVGEKFEIIPDEAEIVRMIFTEFVNGASKSEIKQKLTVAGYRPKRGGEWNLTSIDQVLRNEKYMGVLVLQKYFTVDHISKKVRENHGELPMYRIENNHEPIVSREIFEKAQSILSLPTSSRPRKPYKKETAEPIKDARKKHPLAGRITCGQCGKSYHRKVGRKGTPYEIITWACTTYSSKGKAACPAVMIPERVLLEIDEGFDSIIVQGSETLLIIMPDGKEILRKWHKKTNREIWSDEKRQQARETAIANAERRKTACQQPKE